MGRHSLYEDGEDDVKGMDYGADYYGPGYSEPVAVAHRPTLFGREPALTLAVASGAVAVISSSILPLTVGQQGALNTLAAAVVALILAVKVAGGTWAAALLGAVQALIAVALAFKFELSPDLQAGIMVLVSAVAGFATRQVVTAPEPPAVPGSSPVA